MLVHEAHDVVRFPYRVQSEDMFFAARVIAPLVVSDALGGSYARELADDGAVIFGTKSALNSVFDGCTVPNEVMRAFGVNPDETDSIDALLGGVNAGVVDEIHLPEGWTVWFEDADRLSEVLDIARRDKTLILELPSVEGFTEKEVV